MGVFHSLSITYTNTIIIFLSFLFFIHAMQLAGSWFPNQGWKPGLLQWKYRKCGFLTTGPPGNSHKILFYNIISLRSPGLLCSLFFFSFFKNFFLMWTMFF